MRARIFFMCAIGVALICSCKSNTDTIGAAAGPASNLPTEFAGTVELKTNPESGATTVLKGRNLSLDIENREEFLVEIHQKNFGAAAIMFVEHYCIPMSFDCNRARFSTESLLNDSLGNVQVRLRQDYDDLPVENSQLVIEFDASNHVTSMRGLYATTVDEDWRARALSDEEIRKRLAASSDSSVQVSSGQLVIHLSSNGSARAAMKFDIQESLVSRRAVYIDAITGKHIQSAGLIQPDRK